MNPEHDANWTWIVIINMGLVYFKYRRLDKKKRYKIRFILCIQLLITNWCWYYGFHFLYNYYCSLCRDKGACICYSSRNGCNCWKCKIYIYIIIYITYVIKNNKSIFYRYWNQSIRKKILTLRGLRRPLVHYYHPRAHCHRPLVHQYHLFVHHCCLHNLYRHLVAYHRHNRRNYCNYRKKYTKYYKEKQI